MHYSTVIDIKHLKSLPNGDNLIRSRTSQYSVRVYVNNDVVKHRLTRGGVYVTLYNTTGYFRNLEVGLDAVLGFEISFNTIREPTFKYFMYFTYESTRYMSRDDHVSCITRMFVKIQREQIRLLCLVIKTFSIKKRLPDELEWLIGEYVITEFVK